MAKEDSSSDEESSEEDSDEEPEKAQSAKKVRFCVVLCVGCGVIVEE